MGLAWRSLPDPFPTTDANARFTYVTMHPCGGSCLELHAISRPRSAMSDHAPPVQLGVSALFEVSNIGGTALVLNCKSEAIGAGMVRVKDFSQPLPWSGQMAVLRLPRNAPKTHARVQSSRVTRLSISVVSMVERRLPPLYRRPPKAVRQLRDLGS